MDDRRAEHRGRRRFHQRELLRRRAGGGAVVAAHQLEVGLAVAVANPDTRRLEPGRVIDAARRAEDAGFDAVYVGDHLVHPHPMLESLVTLTAVAASTERIVLGPCVLLLALRHPPNGAVLRAAARSGIADLAVLAEERTAAHPPGTSSTRRSRAWVEAWCRPAVPDAGVASIYEPTP